MTLIDIYQQNGAKLSKTEIHILLKLDQEYTLIDDYTITGVADFVNSSTTSINRLIKKLNFENYASFKFYLKSRNDIPQKILSNDQYELEQSIFNFFTSFDFKKLHKLVDLVNQYETIYVVAVGQSKYIAEYFSSNIRQFGKNISVISESHMINTMSKYLPKNSLVLFISSSGNTKILLLEASILKQSNFETYSITCNTSGEINSITNNNISLSTTNFELNGYKIYSQSPMYILIDLLIVRIAEKRLETSN